MLRLFVLLQFRRIVVACILATDMTCHFGLTEDLKNTGARGSVAIARLLDVTSPMPASSPDDPLYELTRTDKDIILKTLLHAADISNPCKPWQLCKEWSDRVLVVCRSPHPVAPHLLCLTPFPRYIAKPTHMFSKA
jgi:hypothetical protein